MRPMYPPSDEPYSVRIARHGARGRWLGPLASLLIGLITMLIGRVTGWPVGVWVIVWFALGVLGFVRGFLEVRGASRKTMRLYWFSVLAVGVVVLAFLLFRHA